MTNDVSLNNDLQTNSAIDVSSDDSSNLIANATATLVQTWPIIGRIFGVVGESTVDETTIGAGVTVTGNATLDPNYTVTNSQPDTNYATSSSPLTSNGQPVTVTTERIFSMIAYIDPTTGKVVIPSTQTVFMGTAPDGHVVFTLNVNPDGSYKFTLLSPLDQTNGHNPLVLDFSITAVDGSGHTEKGLIQINVTDNAHMGAIAGESTLDEATVVAGVVADVSVSGQTHGLGANVSAINQLLGSSDNHFTSSAPLTSNGQAITVTPITIHNDLAYFDPVTGKIVLPSTATSYVGTTPDGHTVFTLTINPDGSYKFDLTGPLDQKADHTLVLDFGVTSVDSNGHEILGTIQIDVKDSKPAIVAESEIDETPVVAGAADVSVSGQTHGMSGIVSVINELGTTDNHFTSSVPLTSDGQVVTVSAITIHNDLATYNPITGVTTLPSSATSYVGTTPDGHTVFTLTVNPDGSYKFDLTAPLDQQPGANGKDILMNFGIMSADSQGHTQLGVIQIDVAGSVPAHATIVGETSIFETPSSSVSAMTTGQVIASFSKHGTETIGAQNNEFSSSATHLTSDGQPVTVSLVHLILDPLPGSGAHGGSVAVYIGQTANGNEVFTLQVNPDGTYKFTLNAPLDLTGNQTLKLDFGITGVDAHGHVEYGTIQIDVHSTDSPVPPFNPILDPVGTPIESPTPVADPIVSPIIAHVSPIDAAINDFISATTAPVLSTSHAVAAQVATGVALPALDAVHATVLADGSVHHA